MNRPADTGDVYKILHDNYVLIGEGIEKHLDNMLHTAIRIVATIPFWSYGLRWSWFSGFNLTEPLEKRFRRMEGKL